MKPIEPALLNANSIGSSRLGCPTKALASTALALAACLATAPAIGADTGAQPSGAAAGVAADANTQAERCDKTLGVIRIDEDTRAPWYVHYKSTLGSTVPLLRLMIQESNCFVIVERGSAERSINDETRRSRGDEARESETRGKGQQVSADYLLKPEIIMSKKDNEGAAIGGFRIPGLPAGMLKIKSSEAGTVLTLVDIRSTVQLASAEGRAKDSSVRLGGIGGAAGVLAGSAYSNTDQGKIVSAAFFDAYNKMIVSLRQYKAQAVEGGMGEGGKLGVSGGSTRASKEVTGSEPKP